MKYKLTCCPEKGAGGSQIRVQTSFGAILPYKSQFEFRKKSRGMGGPQIRVQSHLSPERMLI